VVVEVEGIDVVAGLKSMLVSAVSVIVLNIENLVNADADADAVTRNAEASAVDMHNI
jgi:hypothetical protein